MENMNQHRGGIDIVLGSIENLKRKLEFRTFDRFLEASQIR